MKNNDCLIIAHRGESYDAPENTIASINLAWQRGADAVEIDIQLSKDNEIIVFHDANTKRICAHNQAVIKQNLIQLKRLDAGAFKDIKYSGEKIPTLSEVFPTVPEGKKLIIEIKCGPEIIEKLAQEILASNLSYNQIEIISFDISTAAKAKKTLHKYNVMLLSELDYTWLHKIFKPSVEYLVHETLKHKLDGLDVWAGNMIDKQFVEYIKSKKLILYTWTVNDVSKAQFLRNLGVDGITTDRAQWLKEKLTDIK